MRSREYTVVIAFNYLLLDVLLIQKEKPKFQKGLFNGIGGKVEHNETITQCACREFYEECGIKIRNPKHFATLSTKSHGIDAIVYFYTYVLKRQDTPQTKTKEKISWSHFYMLQYLPLVPNLYWLITLAKLQFTHPKWKEKGSLTLT